MNIDNILNNVVIFCKEAEFSEREIKLLESKPARYNRTDTPTVKSPKDFANDLHNDPSELSYNGVHHAIKLLDQMIRSNRLKRQDNTNLIKAVDFLRRILKKLLGIYCV